jgi:hypothetical protein
MDIFKTIVDVDRMWEKNKEPQKILNQMASYLIQAGSPNLASIVRMEGPQAIAALACLIVDLGLYNPDDKPAEGEGDGG